MRLRIYVDALDLLANHQSFFPDTETGLLNLFDNAYDSPAWRGPYLGRRHQPVDAWGHAIVY
jgi:hypothetical protein